MSENDLCKNDNICDISKEKGLNFDRTCIFKCTSESEWNTAKYFRDKYFFVPAGMEDPYTWTFDHPEHLHFLFYYAGSIDGYAHIQLWPDARAAVRIIVVDETRRSKGLGSAFLALLEEWLKKLGIKSVHAESRKSSLGFYLKNGYLSMPFGDPDGYESDPADIAVGKSL